MIADGTDYTGRIFYHDALGPAEVCTSEQRCTRRAICVFHYSTSLVAKNEPKTGFL